jgi:peptidoglycan DL-endopeptidase CwlO
MYVGGSWIVHAPHSGDVVRMRQIDSAPIKSYGRPG